jgi:hypothetical protein
MSECAFVKEVYLTPLCLRSALDPKVASAVSANFSRGSSRDNMKRNDRTSSHLNQYANS